MGARSLVVLHNAPEQWLKTLIESYQWDYVQAISDIDRADRISSLLGSERDMLVVQLGYVPDLGLLAAAAGTLRAGGMLIVSTRATVTSENRNKIHQCLAGSIKSHSHSTLRLESLALNLSVLFPNTILCMSIADDRDKDILTKHIDRWQSRESQRSLINQGHQPEPVASAEQNALLEKACTHLDYHRASLIVITGRRGRGKSTLMARIAIHLKKNVTEIFITAQHESALKSYAHHSGAIQTTFISPEAAAIDSVDTLLVDEAASFPLKLLQRYAQNARQLILCSTTEGYEASGRALDVRLLSELSSADKHLLHLKPVNSWRWHGDDPVEHFINRLILNHHTIDSPNSIVANYKNVNDLLPDCHVRRLSQQELISNEPLLTDVHRLLSATHYQTTTKDIEHLLDAPSLQLWVQIIKERVVGVLLLEDEGQLEQSLHIAIVSKQRRLKNQLLPQLLAQMADDGRALSMRYGRVVRIAVAPEFRRLGMATELIKKLTPPQTSSPDNNTLQSPQKPTPTHQYDAIGASFASDACSIAFWQSQGYTEFHRGFRANPRTGKNATAMLRCFEPVTQSVLTRAIAIHNDNEQARQNSANKPQKTTPLTDSDIRLLTRFANRQRNLHDTFAAVQRLADQFQLPSLENKKTNNKQYERELRAIVKASIEGAGITYR